MSLRLAGDDSWDDRRETASSASSEELEATDGERVLLAGAAAGCAFGFKKLPYASLEATGK